VIGYKHKKLHKSNAPPHPGGKMQTAQHPSSCPAHFPKHILLFSTCFCVDVIESSSHQTFRVLNFDVIERKHRIFVQLVVEKSTQVSCLPHTFNKWDVDKMGVTLVLCQMRLHCVFLLRCCLNNRSII